MILDAQNKYSDAQVVTGSVASTNVIDHLASPSGLGAGKEMMIFASIIAATLDTGNVTVTLNTSDAEAFGSGVVALASKELTPAEMTVGAKIHIPIPPDYKALRYTRLNFVAGTNSITVDAYLVPQDHQDQYFASKAAVEQI